MKEIPLSRGLVAVVDDADYEYLSQWKWCALRQGRQNAKSPKWRAVRGVTVDGKPRLILMHRLLVNASQCEVVDHLDGNPLNNTRSNLRVCSQAENCQNRNPESGVANPAARRHSSGQKGVTYNRRQKKWVVQINRSHIGVFEREDDAVEAARAALGG